MATSCALALALTAFAPATVEAYEEMPGMEDAFESGAPGVEMGGGEFFSQDLGTLLRLRYNTESYGQDRRGNFDIGTMQVQSFEDAIAFFDGQATLNDVNGVGYNLGVGFRWLHWSPIPIEPERITGFSFWADGTSTESGNFFPQVGLSFESLGDRFDLRVNGYIPVGQKSQLGSFSPTGAIGYDQNFLVEETIADRNTSFYVAEAELAARLMPDRDAWAFAGPYTLVNDEKDTAGYRAGFRGYAYPDLLLQIAVTDDDIFKTRAAFQVTWFVGRTRNNFQPACGLADRMREPVMRNDYVALERTTEFGGNPLTGTDGEPIRIVHVFSDAPGGGNGTYENPLNDVGDVQGNSIENDIVLLWSESLFQNQNTLVLQDNQRLLGEGNGEFFTVNTQQRGTVVLPETRPGSRDFARSIIQGATGAGAVRLADTNEVANFNIDGTGSLAGAEGIFSPGTGAGNPNIHDLDISNVSGTGIQFTPLTRPNETNPTLSTVAGNVTIDDVNFNNMGGVEIDINSFTSTDVTNPLVTLQETISISDVNSQEGSNIGVWLRNTHDNGTSTTRITTITNYVNGTAGTAGSGGGDIASGVLVFEGSSVDEFDGNVTLTNIDIFNNTGYALHFSNISEDSASTISNNNGLVWNGGTGAAGGMRFNNFDGTITGNSSTLSNGTLSGVRVTGTSDGTINLLSTVTYDSIDPGAGEAIINIGPGGTDSFTGAFTAAGAITNHDTGRLVSIQRVTAADATVTLSGNMTDVANGNSTGILVANNTDGTITFGGTLTVDTTGSNAIDLENNNDNADILFNGRLLLTTDGANARAFEATGGGTLTVAANNNEVTTNGSAGVWIDDMVISATGANFGEVNVGSSADNGVNLANNTGGPITIGTLGGEPGDSGTIENTVGDAVVIENSANVTVSSLTINATAGQAGVSIEKNTAGTQTVNLNDLDINEGEIGVEVTGNGTGTLNLTINDTTIDDPTGFGLSIDNIDAGTIAVNGTTIDGDETNAGAQGVQIVGSNATITFDASTLVQNFNGTEFEVDGGTGNVTYNGDINNAATSGRSVFVHDRTGGAVQFSSQSSIDDDGQGILVEDNTAGTISFLGTNDLDPAATAAQAIMVQNNTGATVTFAGLNINTAAGSNTQGLVAQGGGTISVNGTTNIINTENGAGLILDGMTIGSVDFQTVTVDGGTGPATAILLNSLTGGQVEIGTTTGAQNSGGVLRTTSDAIVVTNAQNVALRDMQILSAGGRGIAVTHNTSATSNMDVTVDGLNLDSSTGNGVEVTAASNANSFVMRLTGGATGSQRSDLEENVVVNSTGSGLFQMKVENTDINVSGATDAFATNISAGATNVDMIFSNTDFAADTGSALSLVTSGGTAKTLDLLVENGSFTNSSATDSAADFSAGGNVTYNATIRGNTFDNGDPTMTGEDFTMTSVNAQSRVRLNLGGDDSTEMNTAGGQGDFVLTETAGDFDVFEKDDTFLNLRNNGTVVPIPNAAAFDNLPVAPVVPIIP